MADKNLKKELKEAVENNDSDLIKELIKKIRDDLDNAKKDKILFVNLNQIEVITVKRGQSRVDFGGHNIMYLTRETTNKFIDKVNETHNFICFIQDEKVIFINKNKLYGILEDKFIFTSGEYYAFGEEEKARIIAEASDSDLFELEEINNNQEGGESYEKC